MKKLINIINKYPASIVIFFILLIWSSISYFEVVPTFLLPNPISVIKAFFLDFDLIFKHLSYTLFEAFLGLFFSILVSFVLAILMDRFSFIDKSLYPLLIISQTIPTICIAPLFILWFGFGILPKIILIFLTCFFPLVVSILSGFKAIDKDYIKLLKSMNANYFKILILVKIPLSIKSFFAGLKIATSYSIVGAVVSEWLGGEYGIGVYMTRVRKSYDFDKMFAVTILITIISLLLIKLINFIENKVIYWEK